MKCCEFCGKEIHGFDIAFFRNIEHTDVTLCNNCALTYDKHSSDDPQDQEAFISWSNDLLMQNKLYEPFRTHIINCNRAIQGRPQFRSNDAPAQGEPQNNAAPQPPAKDTTHLVSVYSKRKAGNKWIAIIRFLAFISVITSIIVCSLIGLILQAALHISAALPLLGGILGLIIGIGCSSFVLMLASLCQDVSEIKKMIQRRNQ